MSVIALHGNYDASWIISATVTVTSDNFPSEAFVNVTADLLHDVEGEGADLLEGVDGDLVVEAAVAPLLEEVIVDFTGADENLR